MRSALLLLALFSGIAAAQSTTGETSKADRTYRLQWRDLDRMVRGRQVTMTLPSGIRLQGEVASLEPDEMVLTVTKTSDRHAYPKGRGVVPRPEVQRLRVRISKGATGRAIGVAVGGGVGTLVAVPVAAFGDGTGRAVGGAIAAVGIGAVIGYAAGYTTDVRYIDIIVEPGP